jgi:hypothetical protein
MLVPLLLFVVTAVAVFRCIFSTSKAGQDIPVENIDNSKGGQDIPVKNSDDSKAGQDMKVENIDDTRSPIFEEINKILPNENPTIPAFFSPCGPRTLFFRKIKLN